MARTHVGQAATGFPGFNGLLQALCEALCVYCSPPHGASKEGLVYLVEHGGHEFRRSERSNVNGTSPAIT